MDMLQRLVHFAQVRNLDKGHLGSEKVLAYLVLGSSPQLIFCDQRLNLPLYKRRGSNAPDLPNDFYDSSKYVLDSQSQFWEHVYDLATNAGDSSLATLIKKTQKALQDPKTVASLESSYAVMNKKTELLAQWIVLSEDGKSSVTDKPDIFNHFAQLHNAKFSGESSFCFVTGEKSSVPKIYRPAKRVPGGQSSGHSLFSWNSPVFEYSGRSQSQNFPMGYRADLAQHQAMLYLTDGGGPHSRRCLVPVDDNHSLMWLCDKDDLSFLADLLYSRWDLYADKSDADKRKMMIRERLAAAWGMVAALDQTDSGEVAFYAIRGSKGRVSVMNEVVITLAQLRENLLRFRDAFEHDVSIHTALDYFHVRPGNMPESLLSAHDRLALTLHVLTGQKSPDRLFLEASSSMSPDDLLHWFSFLRGPMNSPSTALSDNPDMHFIERVSNSPYANDVEYWIGILVYIMGNLRKEGTAARPDCESFKSGNRSIYTRTSESLAAMCGKADAHVAYIKRASNRTSFPARYSAALNKLQSLGPIPGFIDPTRQFFLDLGYARAVCVNKEMWAEYRATHAQDAAAPVAAE